jgi:hypothetical protein
VGLSPPTEHISFSLDIPCRRQHPGRSDGSLFAHTFHPLRPSPKPGGSAPASLFSGPAQRLLTLRPACSPGRLRDPLHQRLQQFRCLHCCSDCYRVERTSSWAGIPPLWTSAFTAHPVCPLHVHLLAASNHKRCSITGQTVSESFTVTLAPATPPP